MGEGVAAPVFVVIWNVEEKVVVEVVEVVVVLLLLQMEKRPVEETCS